MTTPATPNAPKTTGNDAPLQNLPIVVHAQYVRDVSFENPNAPQALRTGQEAPKMDINIGLDVRRLEDDKITHLYEVLLKISARAQRSAYPVYVAEVEYATVVSLQNVPEQQHHPLLLIEVPKLAFPFARKVMADLTQEGGYPPLMLGPVDFASMYINQFADKGDKAAASA